MLRLINKMVRFPSLSRASALVTIRLSVPPTKDEETERTKTKPLLTFVHESNRKNCYFPL